MRQSLQPEAEAKLEAVAKAEAETGAEAAAEAEAEAKAAHSSGKQLTNLVPPKVTPTKRNHRI